MELTNLRTLFIHELRDLHSAETQLLDALPKMMESSSDEQLQSAFEKHLGETENHVERLEQILEQLGEELDDHRCKGMEGLIEEGDEVLENGIEEDVRDAAIISAAQRVEHYEMAGYGTAVAHARMLSEDRAVQLLSKTLEEEKAADSKLTEIAERSANVRAERGAR